MYLITDLLEKKHRLFGRLKENMEAFQGALQRGEEAPIERLTREREEILKTIDALDGQLTRAGFPGSAGESAGGPGGGVITGWIGKIKEVWQDVFQLNLVCLEFAEVRCRDLKSQMAAMGREVQTVKKYLPPNPYTPRFIDMIK